MIERAGGFTDDPEGVIDDADGRTGDETGAIERAGGLTDDPEGAIDDADGRTGDETGAIERADGVTDDPSGAIGFFDEPAFRGRDRRQFSL